MTKKEKYVMFCPKCKSIDIYTDNSNPLQGAMGLPSVYVCNKCKYSANIFPEVKLSELEGFEEEINKKDVRDTKKNETSVFDTSYGDFVIKIFWKITAPITIFIGILLLFLEPIYGIILTLIGIFMFYITYFKK